MSTEHTIDRRAIDESWVMATTPSLEKKDTTSKTPRTPKSPKSPKNTKGTKTADPLTSSWVSGPELIMPSICEARNIDESWVEYVRTPTQPGSEGTKKRRKVSSPGKAREQNPPKGNADAGSSAPAPKQPSEAILGINTTLARAAINTVLIALILHLLILPELVHQAKDLCRIPSIETLYASSCTTPHPHHQQQQQQSTPLTTTQTNLQSILNTTLITLTPLNQTLKETETHLSTLSTHLKTTLPTAHHALDLEFTGISQSLQTAIREYDSLLPDLRSALESLLSTATPQAGLQARRRAEYLARLRAQIGAKAESLTARFSTLDDHLEAVGIVAREHARDAARLGASPFAFFRRSVGDEQQGRDNDETFRLLRAAGHHRAVADSVLWLARQLGST
jgi:hypothetical protein